MPIFAVDISKIHLSNRLAEKSQGTPQQTLTQYPTTDSHTNSTTDSYTNSTDTASHATYIHGFQTSSPNINRVVDGGHPDWTNMDSGVLQALPQGIVLGPLHFLLCINNLPHGILSTVRLFADDCVMYHTIKTDSYVQTLQHDLNTLTKW